jgi:hypothetical protein
MAALELDEMRRQVRRHLCRAHGPEVQDLSSDTLQARVVLGVASAQAAGLAWVSSVGGFVALMFTIAPDFHRHALVRPLLEGDDARTAGLSPDERLFALGHLLAPRQWEHVRRDRGGWPESPS